MYSNRVFVQEVEGSELIGSEVVIEGVSKSFGDFKVLNNVSLTIKKGLGRGG